MTCKEIEFVINENKDKLNGKTVLELWKQSRVRDAQVKVNLEWICWSQMLSSSTSLDKYLIKHFRI